jgi:hypothetical protein
MTDLPPELSALASLIDAQPAPACPWAGRPEGAAWPSATAWPWLWSRPANLPRRRQGARLIGQEPGEPAPP